MGDISEMSTVNFDWLLKKSRQVKRILCIAQLLGYFTCLVQVDHPCFLLRSRFVWGFPKENRVDPGNKDGNEWRKNKRRGSETNSADDADSKKASNSINRLDVIERADALETSSV